MKKIAFLCAEHHWPIVKPVYELASEYFNCFASNKKEKIIECRPDAVIVASKCPKKIRRLIPGAYVVWIRHGFSDKNFAKRSLGNTDFACVSSQWAIDDFNFKGYKPKLGYWITGFSAMDQVFHRLSFPGETRPLKKLITILFAPTYNPELSAQTQLGMGWIEKITASLQNIKLLIKPHPLTRKFSPEYFEYYTRVAHNSDRVEMIDPACDVYNIIDKGDILISDASSVIFYYLSLDRPIILVDNEKRFESKAYNPHGPEWLWRDMGDRVTNPAELFEAIERAIESPQRNTMVRLLYKKKVLGETFDGKACDRIVDNLKQLLCSPLPNTIVSRKMLYKKKLNPLRLFGYFYRLILGMKRR